MFFAISPPRASISRTRWPLASPPIAGLQDIAPMVSALITVSRVLAAHSCCGQSRFASGVAGSDNGDIVLFHGSLFQTCVGSLRGGRLVVAAVFAHQISAQRGGVSRRIVSRSPAAAMIRLAIYSRSAADSPGVIA